MVVFSRFGLWRDFLNDNIQATISVFRLIKNMSINPINDREIVSPVEVANAFNTYFSSIGNNLTKSISIAEKSPMEYLCNPVCDSFFIYPTTTDEIENEISN